MKFNLLNICTLFSLALVVNAATPDVYWKSVLPNIVMPKAFKDLVYTPEWLEEKNNVVGVGKGGVAVDTVMKGPTGKNNLFLYADPAVDTLSKEENNLFIYDNSAVDTLSKGENNLFLYANPAVDTLPKGKSNLFLYDNPAVGTLPKGKNNLFFYADPAVDTLPKRKNNLFLYADPTPNEQLKYASNITLFFFENDLHQGTEMNLHLTKDNQKTPILPKHIADSIPFSSTKLPQIYNKFSIKPNSLEAQDMKLTLSGCEHKAIEGEEKYCATSLESMVDFTTTKLGKKVKPISTEVKAKESTPLQKYTIEGVKKFAANKMVVCHKMNYAYAVFYCHKTDGTQAYSVSLMGADGTKANAVAICHSDTSKWNPKHLSFQLLKVAPGSGPICHFLPEDHVGWVPY